MVTYLVSYTPSTSRLFQGTYTALQNYLDRTGDYVLSGSNGSWNVGHRASGRITEVVDGVAKRAINPKRFLAEHYNKIRVTENDY